MVKGNRTLDVMRIRILGCSGGIGAGSRTSAMLIDDDELTDVVTVNGRDLREEITSDVEVLLEDVRTRGDRQHPFWAVAKWQGRAR